MEAPEGNSSNLSSSFASTKSFFVFRPNASMSSSFFFILNKLRLGDWLYRKVTQAFLVLYGKTTHLSSHSFVPPFSSPATECGQSLSLSPSCNSNPTRADPNPRPPPQPGQTPLKIVAAAGRACSRAARRRREGGASAACSGVRAAATAPSRRRCGGVEAYKVMVGGGGGEGVGTINSGVQRRAAA